MLDFLALPAKIGGAGGWLKGYLIAFLLILKPGKVETGKGRKLNKI